MGLKDKLEDEARKKITKSEATQSEEATGKEDNTGKVGFSLANNSFFQKEKEEAIEELKRAEAQLEKLNQLVKILPSYFEFKKKASETTKGARNELEKIYNDNKSLLNEKGILSVEDLIESYSEDEEVVGYKEAQNTEKFVVDADKALEKRASELDISSNVGVERESEKVLKEKIKNAEEVLKTKMEKMRLVEMKETVEKVEFIQTTPEMALTDNKVFVLLVNDTNLEASKILKPNELAVASILKNRQFFGKGSIDKLNYNISHRYNELVRDEEQYQKLLEELRISKKLKVEIDSHSLMRENALNQKGLFESAVEMVKENDNKTSEELYILNQKIEESRDKRLIEVSKKVFEFLSGPVRTYGGLPKSVLGSNFTKLYFDDISDWNEKYNDLQQKLESMIALLDNKSSSNGSLEEIEKILASVNKEELSKEFKPKTDLSEILRRYQSNIDKDFMNYNSSSNILDREDLSDILKGEIANRITSLSESRIPMTLDNMYRSKVSFITQVISSHGASLEDQAKKLPELGKFKSLFQEKEKVFQSGNTIPEVERNMKNTVEQINLHQEYGEYMVPRLASLREEWNKHLNEKIKIEREKFERFGEDDEDRKLRHLDQELRIAKEEVIREAKKALELEKEKSWLKRSGTEIARLQGIISGTEGVELEEGDESWKDKDESKLTLKEIQAYIQSIRVKQTNARLVIEKLNNAFDSAFSDLPDSYNLRMRVYYDNNPQLDTVEKYLKYWETFFEGWKDQTIYQRYGNEDIELSADQRAFVYDYMKANPKEK